MKTSWLRAAIVSAMVGLGGCSGSDVSEMSEVPAGETLAAASINPAPALGSTVPTTSPATPGLNGETNGASGVIEPFRNPFAPPKDPPPPLVVEEPEPEPETAPEPAPVIREPGTPPKIRLLGFVNVGEPKVLVSYLDELQTLAVGDTLADTKIIGIESPDLTMLFEEREIKLNLFDQPWQNDGSPVSAGTTSNNSHTHTQTRPRSTNPSPATSSSPLGEIVSSGSPAPGGPARESEGIPGFGPNAGTPPESQPRILPGPGSTPKDSIGNPPPNLPGLGSGPDGGPGNGGDATPLPLRLDANVGTTPGPSNLPAASSRP